MAWFWTALDAHAGATSSSTLAIFHYEGEHEADRHEEKERAV
jgi:hypothetical protein